MPIVNPPIKPTIWVRPKKGHTHLKETNIAPGDRVVWHRFYPMIGEEELIQATVQSIELVEKTVKGKDVSFLEATLIPFGSPYWKLKRGVASREVSIDQPRKINVAFLEKIVIK